jgi:hypothetical protein
VLKKAGAVAAIAAGLMMLGSLGSPAFAEGAPSWNNGGLLSALNSNNVNATAGVCGNNVGVLGAAVPINSPVFVDNCAAGGIVDGDDVNFEG